MIEGPIYGPLTERENALVERTYMGAILARQILDSLDEGILDYSPANKATHICQIDCECYARLERK